MAILSAPATLQPCELYRYHQPIVVVTEHHHQKPEYLQKKLWGEVRFGPSLWVCGNCHNSIHAWLSWLLGELRHEPDPHPGSLAKREAQNTFDWYMGELALVA